MSNVEPDVWHPLSFDEWGSHDFLLGRLDVDLKGLEMRASSLTKFWNPYIVLASGWTTPRQKGCYAGDSTVNI
jgi:hypothetical protein